MPALRGAAFGLALHAPAAMAATWAQVLEGRWTGPEMTLTIDQGAIMANRDPSKPFDWQPFRIVTTTGTMVVFDIGPDRYIGILGQDTLSVTRAGSTGSWQLVRDRSDPAHPPASERKR